MKKIGLLLVVVIMSSLTALSQKKRDISDATYIIITETEEAIDSTALCSNFTKRMFRHKIEI